MACPHVSGAAALVLGEDNSKSPQKVISDLLDESTKDALSGLRAGDTNALLYVGAGGAPQPVPTPAPVCVERDSDWGGSCECNEGEYLADCYDGWTYDTATCCLTQRPSPGCRRVESGLGGECPGLCSASEYMQSCEDGWSYDTAICCLFKAS